MRYGFFVTHYWMVKELGLKGNEIPVYAIIFGFSHDGASEFTGSLKYLADFTCAGRTTVVRSLNSLVEKGLIIKREYYPAANNKLKFCSYRANLDALNFLDSSAKCNTQYQNDTPSTNLELPQCQIEIGGGTNLVPNNIQDNINNNIESVCMYGIAQNVKLTPSQYEKLKADYSPDVVDDFIEQLSLAKAGKGYKNKNDYYTIISWITHDRKSGKGGMPF